MPDAPIPTCAAGESGPTERVSETTSQEKAFYLPSSPSPPPPAPPVPLRQVERIQDEAYDAFLPPNALDGEAEATNKLSIDIMRLFQHRVVETSPKDSAGICAEFAGRADKLGAFQRGLPALRQAKELADSSDLLGAYKKLVECYNAVAQCE